MTIGSYGVNATGTGVYPTQYVNFGQTATFPMDIFGDFSDPIFSDFEDEVVCSLSGPFFDQAIFGSLFSFYIAPAVTADQFDTRGTTTSLGNGWNDYAVTEDEPPFAQLPSCTDPVHADMTLSYESFGNGIQDTTQNAAWLSLGLVIYDSNNGVLAQLETTGRSIQDPRFGMALSVFWIAAAPEIPYPCTHRAAGVFGYPNIPWPW